MNHRLMPWTACGWALLLFGFHSLAESAVAQEPVTTKVEPDQPTATQPTEVEPAPSEEQIKAAEVLFEEGRKLFFQGNYKQAVVQLTSAAQKNPTKNVYRLLLAKAHRQAGQSEEAIRDLELVLQSQPDHVEAGVTLAELITPEKQPQRVIDVLTPLLKYRHDYPLYRLLAEAHYQREQFDKSRDYYEAAIKLNPQNPQDYYQVGNIYLTQKRFAKAATAYETASNLGLDTGVFHFKLASVYYNLRNYLGQVQSAEIVGGKKGQIKSAWYLLEPIPGQQDKFYACTPKSAIYQVARAQELGIKLFEIRFLEANIWQSARRFAQADRLYASLEKEVQPADAGLFWFYWAQTALGREDYPNYLARLEKAIVAEPEVYRPLQSDALVTVAIRYQQQGDTTQYLDYLRKAVSVNPLSARLHLTLGDAFWSVNQRPAALEQYELVLELEPDHSDRVRMLNRIRGQAEAGPIAVTSPVPNP